MLGYDIDDETGETIVPDDSEVEGAVGELDNEPENEEED